MANGHDHPHEGRREFRRRFDPQWDSERPIPLPPTGWASLWNFLSRGMGLILVIILLLVGLAVLVGFLLAKVTAFFDGSMVAKAKAWITEPPGGFTPEGWQFFWSWVPMIFFFTFVFGVIRFIRRRF